jgi:hypothetical protein
LSRKEDEAKQREVDLKKKEEEVHKKDIDMNERENILRQREEEMMRREADNFRREEEAKKDERAKKDEAFVRQEEADDDDDDSSSENGIEVKRFRDLEAKKQKLKESPARRDWATEGNRHSNYPRIYRQVSYTRQPLDDDDERERERGRSRDREGHWDLEYDKDRDRDGGYDIIHSDPRRSTTYPYSASYSNPSPAGSPRPVPPPYYDAYEDWEGAPGSSRGRHNNYRGPSPDNLDYQRRPDSARLSRQPSYVRSPRDGPDRRFTVDNGSLLFFFSLMEEHAFC